MNEMIQQTVSQKDLFTGKYFSVKVMTVENEKKGYSQREIVIHSGRVCVMTITNDKKIILTKVYRKSIDQWSVELPSTKIETNEDCHEKLKKEYFVKNDLKYNNLKIIKNFYTSPSFSTERIFLYYADTDLESDKIINENLMFLDIDEALRLIDDNKIFDAKTIIGIQWYALNKNILKDIL